MITMLRFSILTLLFVHATESFWPGKTLSSDQVVAKWGKQKFSAERFKDAKPEQRAAMTFDLLSKKGEYIGKSYAQIEKTLGEHDGHYFNDSIPAYIIYEGGEGKSREAWQVVFLHDKSRKIANIIVHKNCCD